MSTKFKLLAGPALALSLGSAVFAQSITIDGNQRIAAQTIAEYADLQGTSTGDLSRATENLYATGLFSRVEIQNIGGSVIILVEENPTVNRINFEGNRRISDEQIGEIVELTPRRVYTAAAAEQDAARIADLYRSQGRYDTTVRPVIIERADNRVDVAFEITEGDVTEIGRVGFVGNRAFSDSQLRRAIDTRERNLVSFLFSNDTYDEGRVANDRQKLEAFYQDRGFPNVRVLSSSAELSSARDDFYVTFNVEEGQQFRFGQVAVQSADPRIDLSSLQRELDVRSGELYSRTRVETFIERIETQLSRQGIPFVSIDPQVQQNNANQTVDITFNLSQGPKVFVERIDIEGNTQTLDRVIRREFRVVEGDPLDRVAIRRAEERIRALGYFSNVEVRVREGSSPNQAIIDVNVEEAPTGSLNFGVGYASSEGITGNVEVRENNFLGRGQRVRLALSSGDDNENYRLSFEEPFLLDRDLSVGFDILYRNYESDSTSYDSRRISFTPYTSFPVSENGRLRLRYVIEQDKIQNFEEGISELITKDEGENITSAVGLTYTYDRRNSLVAPTSGFILRFDEELAGLGGDSQYSKTTANARVYSSLFRERVILSAEVEGGALATFGDYESRITDRFYLGGNSFRGFESRGLGPRDTEAENEDALGGHYYAIMRTEASFPIGLPEEYGIFGGVFADVGTLWGLDDNGGFVDEDANLRASVGASIFWDTALGPLRFNFAKAVKKEDYDEEEPFRFTMDTRF
ncbi:outer membrane protein assembly factor BamA [Paracoccaceae bacterium GXU_MW_L88]